MTPLGLHHLMATRAPLRPRPVGARRGARRLDPGLLPPRRHARHRLRSHRDAAATPWRSTRRRLRDQFANLQTRARRLPALVSPRAVGLPHARPAARCGTSSCIRYTRGVDARAGDAQYMGRASRPTWTRSATRTSPTFLAIQEKEAQVVARRVHRYFQTFSRRPLPPGFDDRNTRWRNTRRSLSPTLRAIRATPRHPFATSEGPVCVMDDSADTPA